MRLLLDTHIWLWSVSDPGRLTPPVATALADPVNEAWLSPVSIWEVLLLCRKKRLVLDPDPLSWIALALSNANLVDASLTHGVALAIAEIELPHRDPADLFLAATARAYDLTLVTCDQQLLSGRGFRVLPNC